MIGIKKFFAQFGRLIATCLFVFGFMSILLYSDYNNIPQPIIQLEENKHIDPFMPLEIDIPVHLSFSHDGGGFKSMSVNNAKITAYNNLPQQTNAQPNVGASNRKVFVGSCAVSRDILRDYKVKYGDVLCIKKTNKCYFIEDTMNKRYDGENGKRVDIFMYDLKEARETLLVSDIVILQQL